ncbi:complement factor D [Engraulis encrasicolus]|uniref:complement factor D n=1 Tax=Engraulis encrasicolus TaxID=184585 RepID=UPI002FD2BC08
MQFDGILFTIAVLWASLLPGECVTGGKEAVAHSRPYMASVQQQGGKHECGAFLISNQWLLSAAHCFVDGAGGRTVVVGVHSLSGEEATKETFQISAVYNHPDFNTENYDNDIALIKLDGPVVESEAVKPLSYQGAVAEPAEGAEVETAGWGSLNNLGSRPDKLHELAISVMSRVLCGRSDYYGTNFSKNMLCAARKRKDTCDGDSGGPLLYGGVAVGITSNGGKKCGSSRKPGLYTIISHYSSWIQDTMTANA